MISFMLGKLVTPKTASEYAFIMFDIENAEDINKGKET